MFDNLSLSGIYTWPKFLKGEITKEHWKAAHTRKIGKFTIHASLAALTIPLSILGKIVACFKKILHLLKQESQTAIPYIPRPVTEIGSILKEKQFEEKNQLNDEEATARKAIQEEENAARQNLKKPSVRSLKVKKIPREIVTNKDVSRRADLEAKIESNLKLMEQNLKSLIASQKAGEVKKEEKPRESESAEKKQSQTAPTIPLVEHKAQKDDAEAQAKRQTEILIPEVQQRRVTANAAEERKGTAAVAVQPIASTEQLKIAEAQAERDVDAAVESQAKGDAAAAEPTTILTEQRRVTAAFAAEQRIAAVQNQIQKPEALKNHLEQKKEQEKAARATKEEQDKIARQQKRAETKEQNLAKQEAIKIATALKKEEGLKQEAANAAANEKNREKEKKIVERRMLEATLRITQNAIDEAAKIEVLENEERSSFTTAHNALKSALNANQHAILASTARSLQENKESIFRQSIQDEEKLEKSHLTTVEKIIKSTVPICEEETVTRGNFENEEGKERAALANTRTVIPVIYDEETTRVILKDQESKERENTINIGAIHQQETVERAHTYVLENTTRADIHKQLQEALRTTQNETDQKTFLDKTEHDTRNVILHGEETEFQNQVFLNAQRSLLGAQEADDRRLNIVEKETNNRQALVAAALKSVLEDEESQKRKTIVEQEEPHAWQTFIETANSIKNLAAKQNAIETLSEDLQKATSEENLQNYGKKIGEIVLTRVKVESPKEVLEQIDAAINSYTLDNQENKQGVYTHIYAFLISQLSKTQSPQDKICSEVDLDIIKKIKLLSAVFPNKYIRLPKEQWNERLNGVMRHLYENGDKEFATVLLDMSPYDHLLIYQLYTTKQLLERASCSQKGNEIGGLIAETIHQKFVTEGTDLRDREEDALFVEIETSIQKFLERNPSISLSKVYYEIFRHLFTILKRPEYAGSSFTEGIETNPQQVPPTINLIKKIIILREKFDYILPRKDAFTQEVLFGIQTMSAWKRNSDIDLKIYNELTTVHPIAHINVAEKQRTFDDIQEELSKVDIGDQTNYESKIPSLKEKLETATKELAEEKLLLETYNTHWTTVFQAVSTIHFTPERILDLKISEQGFEKRLEENLIQELEQHIAKAITQNTLKEFKTYLKPVVDKTVSHLVKNDKTLEKQLREMLEKIAKESILENESTNLEGLDERQLIDLFANHITKESFNKSRSLFTTLDLTPNIEENIKKIIKKHVEENITKVIKNTVIKNLEENRQQLLEHVIRPHMNWKTLTDEDVEKFMNSISILEDLTLMDSFIDVIIQDYTQNFQLSVSEITLLTQAQGVGALTPTQDKRLIQLREKLKVFPSKVYLLYLKVLPIDKQRARRILSLLPDSSIKVSLVFFQDHSMRLVQLGEMIKKLYENKDLESIHLILATMNIRLRLRTGNLDAPKDYKVYGSNIQQYRLIIHDTILKMIHNHHVHEAVMLISLFSDCDTYQSFHDKGDDIRERWKSEIADALIKELSSDTPTLDTGHSQEDKEALIILQLALADTLKNLPEKDEVKKLAKSDKWHYIYTLVQQRTTDKIATNIGTFLR